MKTKKTLTTTGLAVALLGLMSGAQATVLYSNGFETDINGWFTPTRVATGTGGIASSDGNFHATSAAGAGDFTRWGGYNFGAGSVPTAFQEYWTSADIYLDMDGSWANNTRFDYDSAVSASGGGFLSDFIFNGGFYSDSDGSPGSGTSRFIFSASNNSQPGSAYAKNPGRDPIAISTEGWYTFEHHFYEDAGFLAVDMSILNASNTLVNTWTFTGAHAIGSVGGNRYGWVDFNEFSTLAIDNTELRLADPAAVPEPATLALLGLGLAGLAVSRKRQAA